ncbi:MAG: (Fe-S)-binding protein, partial [bacterium]
VNTDSVAVLKHNGYTVVTPRHQSCCGSLHGHNGDLDTGRKLARRMIDAFDKAKVDYVIVNAAGCSSFMKHYDHLLAEDEQYRDKAKAFVAKVRDITEFLAQGGMKQPTKALGLSVTYHEPCHLLHAQKIKEEPRAVLKQIPGVEIIPLNESDWCCGSAGIYNVTQFDASMQLLKRKMDNIAATKAQVVASGNPGCLLQLQVGARRFGVKVKPEHPVTLLRRAYGISGFEGSDKK